MSATEPDEWPNALSERKVNAFVKQRAAQIVTTQRLAHADHATLGMTVTEYASPQRRPLYLDGWQASAEMLRVDLGEKFSVAHRGGSIPRDGDRAEANDP